MNRMRLRIFWVLIMPLTVGSAKLMASGESPFTIERGVSLSGWLAQESPELRKDLERRRAYITREDLEFIRAQGFDHVRIPIDERLLYTREGRLVEPFAEMLHDAIAGAMDLELKVVIDLHLSRFHIFTEDQEFWRNPELQQQLTAFWLRFSGDFGHYPNARVAYELMNEPVPPDSNTELWNQIYIDAVEAIREMEPERTLIVGPGHWNSLKEMSEMRVPEGDRHILLTFHMYEPYLLTHYRAGWAMHRSYDGPIQYPGPLFAIEDLHGVRPEVKQWMLGEFLEMDRESMEALIREAVIVSERFQLPVYCGEFGCYKAVPRDIRLRWYRDVVSIFEAYGIPYTHWDYKCRDEFGIVTEAGVPDPELIAILNGSE